MRRWWAAVLSRARIADGFKPGGRPDWRRDAWRCYWWCDCHKHASDSPRASYMDVLPYHWKNADRHLKRSLLTRGVLWVWWWLNNNKEK